MPWRNKAWKAICTPRRKRTCHGPGEQLIIALREQKKLEKAYALLTANPTPDNLRQRAELALELGRFNEAAPLFRTLLAQTPDDPELKNKFAIAIRALGGKEEAAQALAEAPTPENLDERAQLAMELQRFDEAAELYKELAKIHPDDPEIKNQLAVAFAGPQATQAGLRSFHRSPNAREPGRTRAAGHGTPAL